MKIGYGKVGRSVPLTIDRAGNVGGDTEPVAVLRDLALRNPLDDFYILGRNSGENPQSIGLPENVHNPWTVWTDVIRSERERRGVWHSNLSVEDQIEIRSMYHDITTPLFMQMDSHVWWVGQHGTTNTPLPGIKDRGVLTKPQDWCAHYSSYVFQGINAWRDMDPLGRSEVWLNADPRNTHKMRDLKWPLLDPVLTQYDSTNNIKHERENDTTHYGAFHARGLASVDATVRTDEVWRSHTVNKYSRIELCALMPGTPLGDRIRFDNRWDRRSHFGIVINECRTGVKNARVDVVRDWVLPVNPSFIYGTWTEKSQTSLGRRIESVHPTEYFSVVNTTRCTITTPASGSGWATAKPWESFAAGVVCFFHPAYDTQDHILGDADPTLRQWLRVETPDGFKKRVEYLSSQSGRSTWEWLIAAQRAHFDRAVAEGRHLNMIEERLNAAR